MINIIKNYIIAKKLGIKYFKNNKVGNLKRIVIAKNSIIYNCDISGDIIINNGCNLNNSILRGHINIGKYTSINGPATLIYAKHNSIEIGNYCSIAHNVTIMEFFHNTKTLSTSFLHKKIKGKSSNLDTWSKGSIKIGSDVWIGTGSTILSGVSIGNGAIIGSNSVVNKDVPSFAIVAGNPAKIIKYRFDNKLIEELEKIKWWEYDLDALQSIKKILSEPLNLNVVMQIKKELEIKQMEKAK